MRRPLRPCLATRQSARNRILDSRNAYRLAPQTRIHCFEHMFISTVCRVYSTVLSRHVTIRAGSWQYVSSLRYFWWLSEAGGQVSTWANMNTDQSMCCTYSRAVINLALLHFKPHRLARAARSEANWQALPKYQQLQRWGEESRET